MIRLTVPGASFRLVTDESWVKLRIACHVAMPWPMLMPTSPAHRLPPIDQPVRRTPHQSPTATQRAAAAVTSRLGLRSGFGRREPQSRDKLGGEPTPIGGRVDEHRLGNCGDLPWRPKDGRDHFRNRRVKPAGLH